ncbi:disease resistance protein [Salix suchowensis]|nr:disease resistance protein [Salix suchowensis]
MANFVLRLPATSVRSFSISASSNGNLSVIRNGGPVILELPLDKIRRPLMRTRANDQNKVKELMDSIKEIGLQIPELELIDFGNLEVLPPLGRLPNLEFLRLQTLGVRRLDAGFVGIEEVENDIINEGEIARVTAFPKLKRLVIWDLEEVEEWDGTKRRVGEELRFGASIIIMPQLRELTIFKCPLLRALPDYVLAAPLQLLDITGCPNLRKLYEKEKEKGEDWHMISHIPKLNFRFKVPVKTSTGDQLESTVAKPLKAQASINWSLKNRNTPSGSLEHHPNKQEDQLLSIYPH